MDLSPQNKNFLDVLHKLGMDLKDFPDKTFDGLFENIPEKLNYFFNWFMENITPENVLTPSEQAIYFQLESDQMLPTEEEMECIFASYNPTYEELQSFDSNYVKILLPRDLADLSRNGDRLSDIYAEIESNYFNIKEKHKKMKEESNSLKKQLAAAKMECDNVNASFSDKLEEIKGLLLREPDININLDLYEKCLEMEEGVFNQIKDLKSFRDELCEPLTLDCPDMKNDLACVETSLVLTHGFLKAKKEIEVWLKSLNMKSEQESLSESLMQSQILNHEEVTKIMADVSVLESKLYEKHIVASENKIDKIMLEYFIEKTEICESYITQLNKCKNCLKSGNKLDEALVQILDKVISNLENESCMRKNVHMKIQEHDRNFSNSISNLELQSKRYKEVSGMQHQQQQHPFLQAVKDVINVEGNFSQREETLDNIMELLSCNGHDANFILQNSRDKLQSSIKDIFDNTLCGPTSEVLFVPVELSVKFQDCVECEKKFSHSVKQLASSYMEAKDSIPKSDRKSLLLWIKFLTKIAANRNR